ncbi:MAG: VWA domain-containing protein [Candidatus Riflebacteria bacterium]|nr:VWA domain-containing protein [Candidatus Riflebacteria bacterium]
MPIKISHSWDRPSHLLQKRENHILKLSVLAASNLGEEPRLPLNLAIAFDSSGSMAGDKLVQAKESCKSILSILRPIDRLSLAAFSSSLHSVVEEAQNSPENIRKLESELSKISPAGTTRTDLALDWLISTLASKNGLIKTAILITDGHSTDFRGRIISEFSSLLEKATEMAQSGISLFTIGLGNPADFNTSFLVDLATTAMGSFLLAQNPKTLEPQLKQKLLNIQKITSNSGKIRIIPRIPSVKIVSACQIKPDFREIRLFGDQQFFHINHLSCEEASQFLISVEVPSSQFGASPGEKEILRIEFQENDESEIVELKVPLSYVLSLFEASQINREVDQDRLIWELNRCTDELNRSTDVNRTGQLLENIVFLAENTGKTNVAQIAKQTLQNFLKTGILPPEKKTGILVDARNTRDG